MIEALKRRNRTLLEMHAGMLFFGAVCQAAGVLFLNNPASYTVSLWFGIAFAIAGSIHMCRTLERALLRGGEASGIVTRGYLFRYAVVAAVLIVISMTAYLQPITHKLCNRLFHEEDPAAESLTEEAEAQEGEIPVQNI